MPRHKPQSTLAQDILLKGIAGRFYLADSRGAQLIYRVTRILRGKEGRSEIDRDFFNILGEEVPHPPLPLRVPLSTCLNHPYVPYFHLRIKRRQ